MLETVILDYMSPHCDLELEDSKPIFLCDTLSNDDAVPSLVTEGLVVEEISSI